MPDAASLSDAQLEIMNVVWDRTETTVAEVWNAVSAKREVSRNTVLTMLTRLAEKGWLKYRDDAGRFYYRAAAPRARTLRKIVANVVATAFSGSPEGLVHALLDGRTLNPNEADRIRRMIDESEERRA